MEEESSSVSSVKELVERGGLSHVPHKYVRDRPPPSQPLQEGWEIPLIDMSHLQGPGRNQAVDQIGRACREWGFFNVVNHGVPKLVIESMWGAYHELFELPSRERVKFDAGLAFPPRLAEKISQNKEKLANYATWRDTIRFLGFNPDDANAIAHAPASFRKPACKFFKAVRSVGFELLEAISESLGLQPHYLLEATGQNPGMNVSMLYYSPCPDPDVTIGMLPHKDVATLTLVLQDLTGGLQVLKRGHWVDAKPVPESFVVNVGEAMEIITNGKYNSIVHRVMTNKEKVRSSISCFLLPRSEARIGPLHCFVDEDNPAYSFENHHYNHYSKLAE